MPRPPGRGLLGQSRGIAAVALLGTTLLGTTQCVLPRYSYDPEATGANSNDGSGATGGLGGNGSGDGGRSSGGSAAGGSATGGSASGGGPTQGDDCDSEGELSCAGTATRTRLVCENGEWATGESCASTELCDTQSGDGECEDILDDCLGRDPGVPFCDSADRKVCGPDLVTISVTECETTAHCDYSTTPECAVCLPNEAECNGETLRICNAQRTGFDETECTAAPCNETARACTENACAEDQRDCQGDVLMVCNDDLSDFVELEDCAELGPDGHCDLAGLECDVCEGGSLTCNSAGNVVISCSEDGQMEDTDSCEGAEPHCLSGACVGCRADGDCDSSNECLVTECDVGGTYTCGSSNAGPGTRCDLMATDDGYCDAGDCFECTMNSHCPGGGPSTDTLCRDGECVDPVRNLGWVYANPSSMTTRSFTTGTIYWFLLPPLPYDATLTKFGIQGATSAVSVKMALYAGTATAPTTALAAANPNLALVDGTTEQPADPAITLMQGSRYWVSLRFNQTGTVRGQNQASGVGWIDSATYAPTAWPTFNAGTATDNNGLEWGVYVQVEDLE